METMFFQWSASKSSVDFLFTVAHLLLTGGGLVHLLRVTLLVQQHILARGKAELDDVTLAQLVVSLWVEFLIVEKGAIRRFKIDYVWLHCQYLSARFLLDFDGSKLQRGMLLGAARMINWDLAYMSQTADQIRRLTMQVNNLEQLLAFERVKPPLFFRNFCLGRFRILDNDALKRVLIGRQCAREAKVDFFLVNWRFLRTLFVRLAPLIIASIAQLGGERV